MQAGNNYIVKTAAAIGKIEILVIIDQYVKIQWQTGQQEWLTKEDFKTYHSYVDPKIKIIEKLNP